MGNIKENLNSANNTVYWTETQPDQKFLSARPYCIVVAQPWIDDSIRYFYPSSKG